MSAMALFVYLFLTGSERYQAPWAARYVEGMSVQFTMHQARPVAPRWAGRR